MAKKLSMVAFLLALIASLSFADGRLNGTWDDIESYGWGWRFYNGNWERRIDGILLNRGTYTISGDTITLTTTHARMGRSWMTPAQILTATKNEFPALHRTSPDLVERIAEQRIELMFLPPSTYSFSVSSNALTLAPHIGGFVSFPSHYAMRW